MTIVAKLLFYYFFLWGWLLKLSYCFFCLFVLEIAADFLNFFVWSAVSKLLIFFFLSFFVWGGVTIVAKLLFDLFFFCGGGY